ncbi:cell division protein FtsA [Acetobacteraceae bacterium]|nr:cell division protein FtsA [Acetobacteraceae bacterium]
MNDSLSPFLSKSKIKPAENAGKWALLKKRKFQAAIDIGSNKITCLIGRASHNEKEKDTIEILGCGWVKSEGIASGDIVNVPVARKAILSAYQEAVNQAGLTPKRKEIAINLSCGDPYSHYVSSSVTLGGEEASSREIKQLLEAAKRKCNQHKDRLVRLFPISYVIDGHTEIETPIGQPCYSLDSKFLAVLSSDQPFRTLNKNLEQSNIYPSPYLPAAFASGLAVLQPQERDYGTLVIDLGAGTTSWAFFLRNKPHGIGQVKWGGNYITRLLMIEFGIKVETAEKLKTRYGCPRFGLEDETEISLPEGSNKNNNRVQRSEISSLISTHIRKILSLVFQDISALPGIIKKNAPPPWKRIVLTGGGSLLEGIDNEVSAIFNAPCRLGRPDNAKGIPAKMLGFAPSFACAVGLLTWRVGADRNFGHIGLQGIQRDDGPMERILRFIQNAE